MSEHDVLTKLPAGAWQVDRDSSQVNFRARTFFVLPVNGFFGEFSGSLSVDDEGESSGTLVIETGSIETGIDRRDEHLRGDGFFASARHPEMTFTLASAGAGSPDMFEQDRIELTGSLQVRDRSLPLSFPASAIRHGDHLHLEARVVIDHAAAGLGWARPGMVGRSARAEVALTLRPVG